MKIIIRSLILSLLFLFLNTGCVNSEKKQSQISLLNYDQAVAMAKGRYVIKDKRIIAIKGLMTGSLSGLEVNAIDCDKVYIMVKNADQRKLYLFSKKAESWDMANRKIPFISEAGMFSSNSKPYLYRVENIPSKDKKHLRSSISICEIGKAEIDLEKPDKIITIPEKKVFKSEFSKSVFQLYKTPGKDTGYLLLGQCTQAEYDPLAIIGTIISGGHGGYSRWAFLAEVKDDIKISYHKWPVNHGSNVVVGVCNLLFFEGKCHIVSGVSKEYMPHRKKIEYSIFDLETGVWTKPEEIFRAARNEDLIGLTSLLVNKTNTVLAWYSKKKDVSKSGIFVRSKVDGKWNSEIQLTSDKPASLPFEGMDGGPCVLGGKDGRLCVLWRVKGKGFYICELQNGKWSNPHIIVKDESIEVGCLWDAKFDSNGGLHIVYIPAGSAPISYQNVSYPDRWPNVNLVYVYIRNETAPGAVSIK